MNRLLLVAMLIAGFAGADEKKYYEAFGDDVRYYAEASLCTERRGTAFVMCLDAYRAEIAEECIMKGRKDFCIYFKEMTQSEQMKKLRLMVLMAIGE